MSDQSGALTEEIKKLWRTINDVFVVCLLQLLLFYCMSKIDEYSVIRSNVWRCLESW